jgi:hypothetical protein
MEREKAREEKNTPLLTTPKTDEVFCRSLQGNEASLP